MVKIFNTDCVAGMQKRLPDGSIDVIVTSPPYNLGIDYGAYDDRISRKSYLEWMFAVAIELYRVLPDTGSLFLNLGSKPTDPWVAYDVLAVFRQLFQLQNQFIWVKAISVDGVGSYGHRKPLNSQRFEDDCWEFVFHLTRTGKVPLEKLALGVPYADKTNIERYGKKADLRNRGNTWFVPYETTQLKKKDQPHPAIFPVQLATNCLLVHGRDKIRFVLDPFMGTGTTGKACQELGINCIGFEIDPGYCELAKERMNG